MPRRPSILLLTIVALAACAIFALPARAQEPGPALQVHQVDASAYPSIRAVVSALDASGAPVPGLPAEEFHAFEGEAPITLIGAEPASSAGGRLSVALVIDTSQAMDAAPLDAAKAASMAFVRGLDPADEVALFAFEDAVTTVLPFTADKEALAFAIGSLETGSGASLFRAAQTGAFAAGASGAARTAVVLITASGNGSTLDVTAEDALGTVRTAGLPVFTVALGEAADEAFLELLAAVSMGQHRSVAPDGAAAALDAIGAVLRGQYVLTMTAAGPPDGQPAELRLIAEVAGAPTGAIATFHRGRDPNAQGQTDASGGGNGIARTALIVFLTIVGVGVVAATAYWLRALMRQMRIERHQRAVVAPNYQRAAAQPLPRPAGALRAAPVATAAAIPGIGGVMEPESPAAPPSAPPPPTPAPAPVRVPVEQAAPGNGAALAKGAGRFVEKTPHGRGQTFELGAGPIVIGSSPRECTIVLPGGIDVAPAHVRVWLRDGRYVMHHAGGFRRRTLVGGQPTDWCVLEHGDEVQIGPHRLVYEEDGHERPIRF